MNPVAAHQGTGKAARFNIRATEAEKRLVERAARAARVTASQFMLQAAVRSAEELLADETRFVLSLDQWRAFTSRLDQPAREIASLRAAASKPSPFVER